MNDAMFVIDQDLIAQPGEKSRAGMMYHNRGPGVGPRLLREALKRGEGYKFKLLDDDGELYYTGRFITNEKHEGPWLAPKSEKYACDDCVDASFGEEAFMPLDWARHDAGCTTILYKTEDGWFVL